MNLFTQIVKPNYLCFDVGANIGKKTEHLLSLGATVICFEPQKKCFDRLANRFYNTNNIKLENIALSEEKGESLIYVANADTISSMSTEFITEVKKNRFKSYNWNEQEKVNTDTLDNMIIKYGIPNFIKIDVEGFEYNVLKGLTDNVNIISIEFTPELKHNTKKCMDYIMSLGGEYEFNYSDGETEIFQHLEWLDYNTMWNILSKDDSCYTFGDLYIKNKNYRP